MTTEEKAEAYDKVFARAKRMFSEKELNYLFPELKESEDGRIREGLIQYFKHFTLSTFAELDPKKILAWLEKQSERSQYWKPSEEQLEALDYAYNSCPDTEKGNYYEGVLETIIDDLHKLSEKQGEQKSAEEYNITGIGSKKAQGKLGELIKNLKPANKVEPKFHKDDWVVWDNRICCHIDNIYQGKESLMYSFTDVHNKTHSHSVKGFDNNARLWTIQDAKDGDVLAEDSCIFIIQKLNDNNTAETYCTLYNDGDFDDGTTLYFDIDSTKPATKEQRDLLFRKVEETGYECLLMKKELKKIEQEHTECKEKKYSKCYVYNLPHNDEMCEQCEFNPKNKKPTEWSEEDEKKRSLLISILKVNHPNDYFKVNPANTLNMEAMSTKELVDWLKSLKHQKQWKPTKNQIDALFAAVYLKALRNTLEKDSVKQLEELYNQLKKLK